MDLNNFKKAAFLLVISIAVYNTIDAQESESQVQKRIRSQQYNFMPESFSSSTVARQITSRNYELRVTTDSIIAILPYFGTSYSAQFGRLDDNGITFTSTNFKYTAVPKKKGKWEISIEPHDAKGIRIFLTAFRNGYAQMDVTSPGREMMSFKGYVW